jgi:hypothetical protein
VINAVGGCDFVFDKDYKLLPLNDLESYLKLNHHLPGIPSAKEMESSDGVALGSGNSMRGRSNFFTPSIAIGSSNILNSNLMSIAMGYALNNQANNTISIGTSLTNNILGAIMLGGYNSNGQIPAFSIIPDMTNGTPGYVGIATTTPVCQLDVNGSGTVTAGRIANFSNSTSSVYINTLIPNAGDWNYLTQANDNGIFWDDGSGGGNTNSGFVIAPHTGSYAGIRIDAAGATTFNTDGSLLWTTYTTTPYPAATSNTNGGWTVPITIPNGSVIRTATTSATQYSDGTTGRYLGFGMVDNDEYSTTTGWYWIIQSNTSSSIPACYPMTLLMDVNGNAILTVSQNAWQDYVFNDNYKPMSIEEKELYYKTNKHLPGIDPACVVEKKGLNINKNISGMLQNLEEDRLDITKLYDIIKQQQKEIEELKEEIQNGKN